MRKAVFVAFLLMLGSAVLGATVLREPFAWAATPFQNVIVMNTATTPVPVKQEGTAEVREAVATQFLGAQDISITNPLTLDVSAYRAVRLVARGSSCPAGAGSLLLDVVEGSANYRIQGISFCSGDGLSGLLEALDRVYEVPGRTLRISTTAGSSVEIAVFGRSK